MAVGFPSRLETIFQTLVAAVTLGMVLVIQHTQSRQQEVTQRKLDELLNAVPNTDEGIISLEAGSDDDLRRVEKSASRLPGRRPYGERGALTRQHQSREQPSVDVRTQRAPASSA